MNRYEMVRPESPADLIGTALGRRGPLYVRPSDGTSPVSTEEQLQAINELRRRLDEEEHQLAFRMKLNGATWDEIADTFGLNSRQRAQQKFGQSAGLLDKLDEAKKLR